MAFFASSIFGVPRLLNPADSVMSVLDAIENLESGTKNKHVRNAARSESKETFDWTTDGDDHRRYCTVRWYKRRLFSIAYHWALTFDWGDCEATYEADDEGGYLIPRWKKGGPEQDYEWEEAATFRLECSPREVNQKAKEVPINGAKYVLTKINCHVWVQCMAEALGIDHPGINFPEEKLVMEPLVSMVDGLNSGGSFRK